MLLSNSQLYALEKAIAPPRAASFRENVQLVALTSYIAPAEPIPPALFPVNVQLIALPMANAPAKLVTLLYANIQWYALPRCIAPALAASF